MGNKRGQPKTSFFVQRSIAFKVVQYIRRYNLTVRQAWLKLSEVNSKTLMSCDRAELTINKLKIKMFIINLNIILKLRD